MIADIGFYATIFALYFCIIQASILFLGTGKLPLLLMSARNASYLSTFSLLIAYLALTYSFAISDFSLRLVYEHSFSIQPTLYKLTAVWGNHEGSILLFAMLLSLYTGLYAACSNYEHKNRVIAFQGIWNGLLLAYIIFTSNPFETIQPIPSEGIGLNPLLQDIGLAMHPPSLYIGYTGLSLALSYALAGLTTRINPEWANSLRPWVLIAWAWLTLGIVLGSWWAYRELGWGGFWFWDPVENASLLPWLAATALLHCLNVLLKRDLFHGWSAFLAIICFCLSLVGFFLVRSGILNSVHSFASDPTRGIAMLIILGIVTFGSFILFFLRYPAQESKGFNLFSRESGILLNNVLLMTLLFTIFLGIIYPIITEVAFNQAISVGAPYYHSIANPIMIAIVALACIGPFIPWKKGQRKHTRSAIIPFALSLLFSGYLLSIHYPFLVIIASTIGLWIILSLSIWTKQHWPLDRSAIGMVLAHGGLGVLAISISLNAAGKIETIHTTKTGESVSIGEDYTLTLQNMQTYPAHNYLAREGTFSLKQHKDELTILKPQQRLYISPRTETTEADVHTNLLRDIYIAIGEGNGKESLALRAYIEPVISFVWLGALLLITGGAISATSKQRSKMTHAKK